MKFPIVVMINDEDDRNEDEEQRKAEGLIRQLDEHFAPSEGFKD